MNSKCLYIDVSSNFINIPIQFPNDYAVREFEVLKKVKHENIVKLLAIEEEQDQRYLNIWNFKVCAVTF